ncbi:MAG TPA: permease prefix domain 1-containing protein, partial [Vicinamibacteria bacterium]
MRPGSNELDDEIRGHLALSIQERIARGEDPEAARLAAMKEFGNLLRTQETMREVWRPRWVETALEFLQDVRVAMRSLRHTRGLAATVALMLALGIGANAAVFSVVRQVLFRPLVNREADRIVYVRQSAPGLGAENTTFSMAE